MSVALGPWGAIIEPGDHILDGPMAEGGPTHRVVRIEGDKVIVDAASGERPVPVSRIGAHWNGYFESKRAAPRASNGQLLTIEEADTAIAACGSFSRVEMMLEMSWDMEVVDWLRVFGDWWSMCDNIGVYLDDLWDTPFADLADARTELRHHFMNDDERAAFDALPDMLTIWRGCYAANKWGLSWSMDRATAERFPTLIRYRQEGQPLLVKAKVAKQDIIALKLDRGESEVIAWRPKHIATSHIRVMA